MFASREDRGGDQSSSEEHALKERKFRDITSYLVSAGYFRAQSERVSRFDRVVGGMCWCITHSHTALDVDVLFRTQSTTGQNIKLAESIVHCVRAMGCPVSLQAHQIHGQDWVNVHPVIAWLIKTMFEARAARFERLPWPSPCVRWSSSRGGVPTSAAVHPSWPSANQRSEIPSLQVSRK